MQPYRAILWGTGEIYNTHLNGIRYLEKFEKINVVGIISASFDGRYKKVDGYQVIDKSELEDYMDRVDLVIVMTKTFFRDIYNEIVRLNNTKARIVSYKITEISHLDFADYLRLVDSKISIISNNCWGGYSIQYAWHRT